MLPPPKVKVGAAVAGVAAPLPVESCCVRISLLDVAKEVAGIGAPLLLVVIWLWKLVAEGWGTLAPKDDTEDIFETPKEKLDIGSDV